MEKSSFKNSIVFINIAWENGQPGNYKEQVNKYYNRWNSILEFQEQKTGVVKQLHISSFPTFILLSPSRKILLRKSGADQFASFANNVKRIIK
jgi:protein-disulfide isomerase-like protein with CxxC motif